MLSRTARRRDAGPTEGRPKDRHIFVNVDETETVANGCAKTELDAQKILKDNCASCHDKGSAVPHGTSCQGTGSTTFDFVLDTAKMKTETWQRDGKPSTKYISVGDADASAIFVRAGVLRDMPPLQLCLDAPFFPRVNFSEISVLRAWIEDCL